MLFQLVNIFLYFVWLTVTFLCKTYLNQAGRLKTAGIKRV